MASHGIARTNKPRTEEQRQIDIDKISRYRALEDQARQRARDHQYDNETFQLTSKLLRQNPEYYTIWNVRRRCLTSGLLSKLSVGLLPSTESPSSSVKATPTPYFADSLASSSTETLPGPDPQTTGTSGIIPSSTDSLDERRNNESSTRDQETIRSELTFTIPLLMGHPKCYWIWKYRLWILDQAILRLGIETARAIWQDELNLVSKMLDKDKRNFHAWGYRRHVVSQLESPTLAGQSMVQSEFDYTTQMIHKDLSNFSAWHSRSKLIPRLLNERAANDAARKTFLDNELSIVRDALNLGPEDQSLWYYHQYLIQNLLKVDEDSTIVPQLSSEARVSCLRDELTAIQDLLEDYADIKWIYEALLEYTLAIRTLLPATNELPEKGDVILWLSKLRELDKKRSGRWSDLEAQFGII